MKKIFIYLFPALVVFAMLSGCGDEGQPGAPPVITFVSPDSASMGDTILVEGERFNPEVGKNRIAFSPGDIDLGSLDRVAVPFEGSGDYLLAVVPDGAFTGKVRAEQFSPLTAAYPMGAERIAVRTSSFPFHVELSGGDVAKAFFNSSSSEFNLPTGGSKKHLMVIFSNSVPPDTSTMYDYTLRFDQGSLSKGVEIWASEEGSAGKPSVQRKSATEIAAGQPSKERAAGRGRLNTGMTITGNLDRRKREDLRSILKRYPAGEQEPAQRVGRAPLTGSQEPPATAIFDVYSRLGSRTDQPENFTKVKAFLEYQGENVLLYVDSLTEPGCITSQAAVDLGESFDQSIYYTDRQYFGEESDINKDGRVAILLSPVVNMLTPPGTASTDGYIGGFFLPGDLLPSLFHPDCTNSMEIFYTIVPDPAGTYGNVFETARALESIEGILGHEFVHMIMFNYRLLKYGEGILADYIEQTWLEEGLAHMAEDLNGYIDGNIGRANRFLRNPGDFSLTYGKDGLAERGAAFLFLRYLGDRYGNSIFRDMVQSKIIGMANVENAVGEDFIELVGDWAAALYLTGRGTTSDSRFEYTSIDLRGDFDQLRTEELLESDRDFPGAVKSMGLDFIELNLSGEDQYEGFLESGGGKMHAVIIRLN